MIRPDCFVLCPFRRLGRSISISAGRTLSCRLDHDESWNQHTKPGRADCVRNAGVECSVGTAKWKPHGPLCSRR